MKEQKEEIKAGIFDFDDTIMRMPTQIKVYNQKMGSYVGLSTSNYARHKGSIGKEGFLKYCNLDSKSFEEFCTNEQNFFVKDIVKILRSGNDHWKAHYFSYFLEMLSTEKDSQNVYILSARAHKPEEFLDGMRILQTYLEKTQGMKIFLPRKEHLHFVGHLPNIPLAKASVIESIVLKESAENTTIIEFADDDEDNVHKATVLLKSLKSSFKSISFVVSHVLEKTANKIIIK